MDTHSTFLSIHMLTEDTSQGHQHLEHTNHLLDHHTPSNTCLYLHCCHYIFQEKTDKEYEKQVSNILKKEQKKRKKMKDLGIDYEFPGYVSSFF